MKARKKAGRISMAAATAIFCIFLVLYALGIRPYIVLSGSMEPSILTGSVVFVDTLHKDPRINDVITYQIGLNRVTHRMVRNESGKYITKGDANKAEDPVPVMQEQIKGIVVFHLPFAGYLIMFFRKHLLFFFVMLFTVRIVLYTLCRHSARSAESSREKDKRKEDSI